MKTTMLALLVVLLASMAQAADTRMQILNNVTTTLTVRYNKGMLSSPQGEIKLMCIAGYKFIFARFSDIEAPVIPVQIFDARGQGVKCEE